MNAAKVAIVPAVALWLASCAHQPGSLRVHFIDVGEGDATLLEWRGARPEWILVDTGNPITGHYALQYLRKRGVKTLEAVIITHPHMDHAGGLFQIAQNIPVRAFYDNGEETGGENSQDVFHRFYREFFNSHPRHATLKAGDKIMLGDAVLEVLWPPAEGFDSPYINARSLVIMARQGAFRVLLAGDMIIPAEEALVRSGVDISADILKAGHHGAADCCSQEFLEKVKPRMVALSVNRGNANGYPARETLERIKAAGAEILRTDRDKDITVESGY